jgi:hypothetical protein
MRFSKTGFGQNGRTHCTKPDDLTGHTGSRPLTTFPGGLTITIMKFLVVVGAKITPFEFFHQPLFFHGTALCGF